MTDSERNPSSQDAQLSGVEEEVDDEETAESENGDEAENKVNTNNSGTVGRLVTLQNLLGAGILQPGPGAMTIDYLGQKFTGDLLANGKIRSHETDRIFASPSAWAVSCKKIVNPDKRSGCGWSSIRYRGKKLDSFKNIWLMKKSESLRDNDNMEDHEMDGKTNENAQETSENEQKQQPSNDKENHEIVNENASVNTEQINNDNKQNEEVKENETQTYNKLEHKPRIVVKHNILGNRVPNHDLNVLVESNTFTSLGKIQPFLITISTNAALVMDFHCHLTTSEVVGYLAGNWDVNSHNLNITQAFPCKCRLGDYESAPVVENEIRKTMKSNGLTLVGWYHSHPTAPATPSIRDIDTQLDYELRMKGTNDSTYLPCVGIICSPYNADNPTLESNIVSYWVVPPPENRIYEYGKPMMMSYSVLQDQSISHDVLLEMKKCADFYKPENDYIQFSEILKDDTTYLEKMKQSLSSKFPLNLQKGDVLWNFIQEITSATSDKPETEILKEIMDISNTPSAVAQVITPEKPKFNIPNIPSPLSFKTNNVTSSKDNSSSVSSLTANSNNSQYQKSHSRSSNKNSTKRSTSRDNKNLASLNNYFVGSDLASALFGSGKFPMGLDPTTKSLLNLSSLSLGNMFLPPMGNYKPDPNVGLMKPPPPPSSYYSYSSSRSSGSRSSSSPSSSSGSRSSSKNMPSTSRDMPPPNKVPKLDVHQMANFFMPPNLNKMCTITSRPSTSTSSK